MNKQDDVAEATEKKAKKKQATAAFTAEQMRDLVVEALAEAKGEDVKVLDVTSLTDMTDFMVVSTGTSDRHVKSQANRVLEMMHEAGLKHLGVEGEDSKDWVLIDFVDVVVHVMRDQARKRYDLESLWDKTFSGLLPEGTADEIMSGKVEGASD